MKPEELFRGLRGAQAKAALRKGTRAAAKQLAEAIKSAVPSGSGKTRSAVKVRSLKRSRTRVGHTVRIWVRSEVPYAAFVELGSKSIRRRGNMKQAFDRTAAGAASQFMSTAVEALESFR